MSGNRSKDEQPGLWDDEVASTDSPKAPGRNQSQATNAGTRTRSPGDPQPPRTTPPVPPTRPEHDVRELWDADRVAAYLGVPKQTLYAWRHSGRGPRGFRVGKYLRWHAHTVVEWTLTLERDQ